MNSKRFCFSFARLTMVCAVTFLGIAHADTSVTDCDEKPLFIMKPLVVCNEQDEHIVVPLLMGVAGGIGAWWLTEGRLSGFSSSGSLEDTLSLWFGQQDGIGRSAVHYSSLALRVASAFVVASHSSAAAYLVKNKHTVPARLAMVLKKQVRDYGVMCSLYNEVSMLGVACEGAAAKDILVDAALQERLAALVEVYQALIENALYQVNTLSWRLCDSSTECLFTLVADDFKRLRAGKILDREAVIALTRGGATSYQQEFCYDKTAQKFKLHQYERIISPLVVFYQVCDQLKGLCNQEERLQDQLEKAYELNEHISQLCDAFERALSVHQSEFEENAKYAQILMNAYMAYDYVVACLSYAWHSISLSSSVD